MYYPRKLDLSALLKKKSFFLFGPRGTGKTSLVSRSLPHAKVYDLLNADQFRALVRRPNLIEEQVTNWKNVIVIDEIQKYPPLLDEVQRLIQTKGARFLLTGSSARKLKRGAANLLGGRAWEARLHPLTSVEITDFDLLTYLNSSGLPHIYGSKEAEEELRAYVSIYLREEIQAEAATRNLQSFTEFLDLAAISNGQEINFETFARDCGVSPLTIKNYFQILQDTLIGIWLPGFTKTKKRKAISRAKHYFFDIGVVNTLCNRGTIKEKSELFGKAFEQFIIQEISAFCSYARKTEKLTYWRSTAQQEVDLIIGQRLALEIKSSPLVIDRHLKSLLALKEEGLIESYAIVSLDTEKRTTRDGISIWPWKGFLKTLWAGRII